MQNSLEEIVAEHERRLLGLERDLLVIRVMVHGSIQRLKAVTDKAGTGEADVKAVIAEVDEVIRHMSSWTMSDEGQEMPWPLAE